MSARAVFLVCFASLAFACGPKSSFQETNPVSGDPTFPAEPNPELPLEGLTVKSSIFMVSGSYLYRCNRYSGIQVIDLRQGLDTVVAEYDTPGFCFHLAIAGNRMYVGDGNSFLILDATNPLGMRELGKLPVTATAASFVVDRGFAYVTDYAMGILAVDVRDAAHPVKLWEDFTYGDLWHPSADGQGLLYLPDTGMGLKILDIRNPAAPVLLATLNTPGYVLSAARRGRHLYIADAWNGVYVLDIGTEGVPTSAMLEQAVEVQHLSSAASLTGYAQSLVLHDSSLYLAAGSHGLRVYAIHEDGSLSETYHSATDYPSFSNRDLAEAIPHGNQVFLYFGNQTREVITLPQ